MNNISCLLFRYQLRLNRVPDYSEVEFDYEALLANCFRVSENDILSGSILENYINVVKNFNVPFWCSFNGERVELWNLMDTEI